MLVGGGTAGHITPLLAVAHELKQARPDAKIIAVTDKGNTFHGLLKECPDIDSVEFVSAGKLRRYHNESAWKKLTDFETIRLNTRDIFRTIIGIGQAKKIIKKHKPAVIFIKGGFVGVPVGVAAFRQNVPFITHDSDTVPGLANRLIGKWARIHAVGMPEKFYSYPIKKTKYVGIPVSDDYRLVSPVMQVRYKKELSIDTRKKLVLVTGGSQGAARLNDIIAKSLKSLTDDGSVFVLHQTGRGGSHQKATAHYKPFEFSNDLYKMSAAADVVVARAGANTFAELAVQGKATILVPSPYLSGGHQVANAKHLADERAVIYIEEKQILQHPTLFVDSVQQILNNAQIRKQLEKNIKKLAKPAAAHDIALLILAQA